MPILQCMNLPDFWKPKPVFTTGPESLKVGYIRSIGEKKKGWMSSSDYELFYIDYSIIQDQSSLAQDQSSLDRSLSITLLNVPSQHN